MVNAGYRDCIDWKKGDNTTADVRKSAEIFKMGDLSVDNVPRNQTADECFPAFFLCSSAGEQNRGVTIPIFLESGHNKANGTIHTGNDGDVAYSTFTNPKGPLIARDNSLRAPQIDEQIVCTVTNERTSFQNLTRTASFN